jgi:hypothetical protein
VVKPPEDFSLACEERVTFIELNGWLQMLEATLLNPRKYGIDFPQICKIKSNDTKSRLLYTSICFCTNKFPPIFTIRTASSFLHSYRETLHNVPVLKCTGGAFSFSV